MKIMFLMQLTKKANEQQLMGKYNFTCSRLIKESIANSRYPSSMNLSIMLKNSTLDTAVYTLLILNLI